jgi:hypothetical protein
VERGATGGGKARTGAETSELVDGTEDHHRFRHAHEQGAGADKIRYEGRKLKHKKRYEVRILKPKIRYEGRKLSHKIRNEGISKRLKGYKKYLIIYVDNSNEFGYENIRAF